MGAGSSVPEVEDKYLDEEACKGLAGDGFCSAKWEAAAKNGDGKVSKADFLAAFKHQAAAPTEALWIFSSRAREAPAPAAFGEKTQALATGVGINSFPNATQARNC